MSAAMEGMQLMAAGEKAANKTSFFGKKTPDWEVARMNYESAASAFKSSRAYDHAVEAHIKCANAYKNLDTIYLAARQLEQAAILMIQQLKKPVEGAHLYREASNYFVAHGSGDKGADVLEKAAKAVETADPALAGELYLEAVSTYESEDKLRQSVDTFTRAISFFLRVKRFAEAADLSQRLATIHAKTNNRQGFNRQGLATAVIALSTGDNVDARKRIMAAFAGAPGFLESEEGEIAMSLIDAFDQGDGKLLADMKQRHPVRLLDNEVALAARNLRVPGDGRGRALQNQPPPGFGDSEPWRQPQPQPGGGAWPPSQDSGSPNAPRRSPPQPARYQQFPNAPAQFPAQPQQQYPGGVGGGGGGSSLIDDDDDGLC